jgi:hypothetical protein
VTSAPATRHIASVFDILTSRGSGYSVAASPPRDAIIVWRSPRSALHQPNPATNDVSVVDIASMKETTRIPVGLFPKRSVTVSIQ